MTTSPALAAVVDRRRIAALRLAAQGLTVSRAASPAEAVGWMLAMQGQDLPGVKWSVGLRVPGATEADVERAMDAGEIVRTWPMRGTLHLVRAEDVHWMLDLTAVRSIASAAQRRAVLRITERDVEQARDLAAAALPGRTFLSRSALLAAIADGGVDSSGQRGYHLLWYLSQTGSLVLGPSDGRQQAFARLDAWVDRPRVLGRPEALAELCLRYVRSHGPATIKDLVRWSGLTVRDLRTGIEASGEGISGVDVDGATAYVSVGALDAPAPECAVRLLSGFDEYVLGYGDRSAILAPDRSEAIVPGGNGMFKSTIVIDGEITGTWSRRSVGGKRGAVVVDLAPFRPLAPAELGGVEVAARDYGRFMGRDVRLGRVVVA